MTAQLLNPIVYACWSKPAEARYLGRTSPYRLCSQDNTHLRPSPSMHFDCTKVAKQ